jgi:hAT family C-terminal dimerisation region
MHISSSWIRHPIILYLGCCDYLSLASDDKLHEGTSVECEESTAGPSWKTAKIDLLSKHSDVACFSGNREIQQYRCFSVASDDLLEWWKQQSGTFPRLSRLARCTSYQHTLRASVLRCWTNTTCTTFVLGSAHREQNHFRLRQ